MTKEEYDKLINYFYGSYSSAVRMLDCGSRDVSSILTSYPFILSCSTTVVH